MLSKLFQQKANASIAIIEVNTSTCGGIEPLTCLSSTIDLIFTINNHKITTSKKNGKRERIVI
jgi:hypothetical protein